MRARIVFAMVVALSCACGNDSDDTVNRLVPGELVAKMTPPPRCAEWTSTGDAGPQHSQRQLGTRRAEISGHHLRFEPKKSDSELIIGIVADARGADGETIEVLEKAATLFTEHGVELVVVLGGMATSAPELEAILDALTKQRQWPILLVAGDRESQGELQNAVASDGARGLVIDGTISRVIEIDSVVLATFPGVSRIERSVAGNRGCLHNRADAESLAEKLAAYDAPKVWLSYAPPRTKPADGSDMAPGGLHIGSSLQVSSITASGANLVVHGAIDAPAPESGKFKIGTSPAPSIAAGSIDPLPAPTESDRPAPRSVATIVRITPKTILWQRLAIR